MPGLYVLRPLAPASKATRKTQKLQQDLLSPSHVPPKSRRPPFVHVSSTLRTKHTQTCPQPIRPKKVTDPLTETVRARIYGDASAANYVSSGSDHDPSSTCLAALVHEFMEDETEVGTCGRARCNCVNGTCSGEGCRADEDVASVGEQFLEILEGVASCSATMELLLLADVAKAIEAVKEEVQSVCKSAGVNCSNGCLRRSVMSRLRHAGYNAAICKSRWDHTGGLPAGNYEYIDVILDLKDGKSDRLLLDMDFKTQFEIARATTQYNTYLSVLPTIFLGKPERLKQILKIMSEAAKCSLKRKGLHLPPWRKLSYMQAKWFSSYKRTTNEEPHDHKTLEEALQSEISSIALKGSQFYSEFTNEVEAFYNEIGSHKLDATGRKGREPMLQRSSNEVVSTGVREIRVLGNEWQLPAVKPRPEMRGQMVSGIAGALKVCRLEGVHEEEEKQLLLAL